MYKNALNNIKKTNDKKLTPLKAIRQKCIECSGGSFKEVRECQHDDCSLFNNRFGKGREQIDERN